jgi:hypothetical protein
MRRPLADKRIIGPVAQMGSINELQFNFRFDVGRDATMEDMKNVVMQNAPPTADIRETLVAPDVKGEAISVTTDNQMVYSDLESWKEKVGQAVSQMSTSSSLKEVVIIGT